MKNKFKGFTLAEILITLLIIGTVASITVPALINETNKTELKVAIKKEYGVAQNAYNLAATENGAGFGVYTYGTTTSYTKFNAIKLKMNAIKTCTYGTKSFGNCWAINGVGQPGASIDGCSEFNNKANGQGQNVSFVAADGSFWMLYTYDETRGADLLAVDVNGNKGPNDWGEDVFVVQMKDRKLDMYANCPFVKRDGSIVLEFRYLLK